MSAAVLLSWMLAQFLRADFLAFALKVGHLTGDEFLTAGDNGEFRG